MAKKGSKAAPSSGAAKGGGSVRRRRKRVRLHRIETENFKSYMGRQTIGPFKDFTCVIGPNGVGKSNLMDAVSFATGVKARELREEKIKELICTNGAPKKFASVALLFRGVKSPTDKTPANDDEDEDEDENEDDNNNNKDDSESESEEEEKAVEEEEEEEDDGEEYQGYELRLERLVFSDGRSEYRIDGKKVSWEVYNVKLRSIFILTKAKNFLIFQGYVEELASKSSTSLTSLFEQVSGSDQYKAEYERLKALKAKASDNVVYSSARKRGMRTEKSAAKLAEKELEKYKLVEGQLKHTQVDHAMLKFLTIEQDLSKEQQLRHRQVLQKDELAAKHALQESALNRKKDEHAKEHSANMSLQKDLRNKAQQEHTRKEAVDKLAIEIEHRQKAIEKHEKEVARLTKTTDQHKEHLAALEDDLEDVHKRQGELDETIEAEVSKGEVILSDDEKKQYHRLQTEALSLTITERQKKESKNREQKLKKALLTEAESKLKHNQTTAKRLKARDEQMTQRAARLGEAYNEQAEHLAQLRNKQEEETRKFQENTLRQKALREQLVDNENKLAEAKRERSTTKRDQEFKEALEAMKITFKPKVHGRVIDLCEPTKKKYELAVTVALGRDLESVVVDDKKTAQDCIAYLKEKRIGPRTFIPLDTIKTKKVDERLRLLGGSYKLVCDLIEYDAKYEKAVQYAISNVICADTFDEARALCFENKVPQAQQLRSSQSENSNSAHEPRRFKCVCLDGSMINKAGIISGGSLSLSKRTLAWSEKDVESLKKARDEKEIELAQLAKETAPSEEPKRRQQAIDQIENKVKHLKFDVDLTQDKLEKTKEDEEKIRKEIQDDLEPTIAALKEEIDELEEEIEEIENEIAEKETSLFKAFGERTGIDNVRDYEQRRSKKEMQFNEEKTRMSLLQDNYKNQIDFERQRDLDTPLAQIEGELKKLKKQQKEKKEKLKKEQAALKKLEEDLKRTKEEAFQTRRNMDDKDTEVREVKKKLAKSAQEIAAREKQISNKDSQLYALRRRRADLLTQCNMHQIPIPLEKAAETSRSKTKPKKRQRRDDDDDEEEEEEEEEEPILYSEPFTQEDEAEEEEEEEEEEQSAKKKKSKKRSSSAADRDEEVIDFSRMPRSHRDSRIGKERDKLISELEKKTGELRDELESIAPGIRSHARKHLDDTNKKYDVAAKEFEDYKSECNSADKKFAIIKKKRCDTFDKAFTPISHVIDRIYKELTKTESGVTGHAYLELEDEDEPYLEGVKYAATPPHKRFREIEHLSGGEKTVAALALLFAIHAFQPSPFFVLDEIDAALDVQNVHRVAQFIRKRAATDTQCIVISLKEFFYENAQALVGVYRDRVPEITSKTLTCALDKFRKVDTSTNSN